MPGFKLSDDGVGQGFDIFVVIVIGFKIVKKIF